MQKLEVDMSDNDYELMDEAKFIEWENAEENFKNDNQDRTTTMFTMDSNKNQVRLEDFKILKLLGRGGFGKVMLCQKNSDNKLYAMKILRKKDIVESDQVNLLENYFRLIVCRLSTLKPKKLF
jgi:serine/threonine protein kinase